MSDVQEYMLAQPHPDIELGVPRLPRPYRVAEPPEGLRPDSGLIFYIHGFGAGYNDGYADKLLPWLAAQYNCVAVAVHYFGAELYQSSDWSLPPDFFEQVSQVYGISLADLTAREPTLTVVSLLKLLESKGRQLDPRCYFVREVRDSYQSFGLLPALDHLGVLHGMLQRYPQLDRQRLYVLGTSYGGYIASFLRKLAPHTFRMIIDNSGFTAAGDETGAILGWSSSQILDSPVLVRSSLHWEEDSASPRYFSPACAAIRNLCDTRQLAPTETAWFGFAGVRDKYFAQRQKDRQAEAFASAGPAAYKLVREADLDGRLFKNLEHGMSASLRSMFAWCYARLDNLAPAHLASAQTDFERATRLDFACPGRTYRLEFDPREGARMSLA